MESMGPSPKTPPMMTGHGQFGPIGMGGMLSVLKVRKDQNPGITRPWPQVPPGTVAHEWTEPPRPQPRQLRPAHRPTPRLSKACSIEATPAVFSALNTARKITHEVQ